MAVRKVPNGKWLVNIQPGGRRGRRIRKSFLTKANADAFARRAYIETENLAIGQAAALSVSQLIDLFRDRYASVRFRGYRFEKYRIEKLKTYFLEHNDRAIGAVKLADGEEFISYRKANGIKPTTISRDLNTLKRIFSWAVENDYIPYSPLAKLKGFPHTTRIRWLTESECKVLLEKAKDLDPSLWTTIFIALNTGFRLSNIQQLRGSDISDSFITALKTKSGKPYDVPIATNLQDLLSKFKTTSERILDTRDIDRRFRKIVKAAGLYTSADDPMKVTFHTLRHTFAAYWLQKNVPIYTVSKWLGHSSVAMTEKVYGHLSQSHHALEIQKAQGIGESALTLGEHYLIR